MNFPSARSTNVPRARRPFYYRAGIITADRTGIKWFIRYTYYAFVFSLPFEMADVDVAGGLLTLSKLLGYLFVACTALQVSICYREKPKALWFFAAYLAITAVASVLVIQADPGNRELPRALLSRLFSRGQMLVLLWVSYNLMRKENVAKATLFSLAVSTTLLVFLQLLGLAGESTEGRVSAFDENPNTVATVLSIGLLALFGLAYGREKTDWKARVLFWTGSLILVASIVRTGSRGAALALIASFALLILKKGDIAVKFKMALFGLVGIVCLAVISYQVPAVRERWELTLMEGKVAGRDVIYAEALGMFLEKPTFGWGPINHFSELGSRLGLPSRDPHNLYLWILTEVGLIGSIPFLAGLWLCWRSAWRSRFTIQGITPLMMISFLLAINMKGSWHGKKLFWLILAYTLASSYSAASNRWRNRPSAAPSLNRKPVLQQPGSGTSPRGFTSRKVNNI